MKFVLTLAFVASVSLAKGVKLANETEVNREILCSNVRRMFVMKGIGPSHIAKEPRKERNLTLCPSTHTCCSEPMEIKYQEQAKKDLRSMLQSSGSYLKTLIATSATKFRDTFLDMVQASENSTTAIFSEVYQLTEGLVPLNHLFADLLAYMSGQDVDLEDRVRSFFDSLFPIIFHHATISSQQREFSNSYKECLTSAQQELRPFGDLSQTVVTQISRSCEAAKSFLTALHVGVEVLNTTEHIDFGNECYASSVRLTYCAHCQGILEEKPCTGFCLNVMRGCLASVSELGFAWSEYISALERLTAGMVGAYNIEHVLSSLDAKISETIMYVMQSSAEISKKVKQKCGHVRRMTRGLSQAPPSEERLFPSSPLPKLTQSSADPSLYIQLQNFAQKVSESKNFYSNLADKLCEERSRHEDCWNGVQLSRYEKPISGVGVAAQKYNPEVIHKEKDAIINTLSEKLQHVKQVLLTRMTSVPQSDSSVAVEGSGSGSWAGSKPSPDDEDYTDGSGSGNFVGRDEKTDIHFENTSGKSETIKTSNADSCWRQLAFVSVTSWIVALSLIKGYTQFVGIP